MIEHTTLHPQARPPTYPPRVPRIPRRHGVLAKLRAALTRRAAPAKEPCPTC